MMKCNKVQAGDSENEFDIDEPEEIGDHSENEWAPTAVAKTPVKRLRPTKSTPARKKKEPKVSYVEEKPHKKERGLKAKSPPPAPIPSSSRGRGRATKVLIVEPEDSEDDEEFEEEGDEEEVGDDSEDEWAPTAVAKTPVKRLRPAKSTPARKKKEPKVSYVEEKPHKKERGLKAKSPPPAPIPSSSRGRGRATKVLIVEPEDSEDDEEFEGTGDEEEVGDDSEDEWAPTAVAKTPVKRLRPAKSTPARKKKEPKVSYVEEKPHKKERGLKAKSPPPAPIPSSSRGRGRATKVLIVEPEDSEDDEEFEGTGDEEEVGDDSEDEWAPTAVAKTPVKRLRPAKSTPARKKKEPKVSYVEEKPHKKERGLKAKSPPPAPIPSSSRGRGRATKVLIVEPEDSEDDEEFEEEGDEEEVGDDSEDEWAPTAVAKTPVKRLRPAKSTPARKKKEPKVSYVEEKPHKKERGLKAKSPPPAPIPSSSRGRGRATKVLIVEPEDSEDDEEFEGTGDEEEVGDDSEDEWAPTAVAKTPVKRLRPAKSTPARKKKEPKVSYVEEKPHKKERGLKAKSPPPAPIPSSSRGRGRATKVLIVEPEDSEDDEEFEGKGDEEEVGDDSEDEWAPTAVAKTPVKRLRPAKSTPARKKKEPKVSYVEEKPHKKERGLKAKSPPPASIPSSSRGRGRATKVLIVEPEDSEEDEDITEYEEEGEEEDDDYLEEEEQEEEEEELNQGPNAMPAQKFTVGAFVVCKTDMIDGTNPYIWKIDDELLLQRYIPFEQDGKVLYKSDNRYRRWGSDFKDQYYDAPVSFIKHSSKEHIIEVYKDKIKIDFEVEELEEEEGDVDVEEEE